MQSASEFLSFIVTSLVETKDQIEITERQDEL
jgi:predicted RNA-binding protein YlqC (UPF0109 family)